MKSECKNCGRLHSCSKLTQLTYKLDPSKNKSCIDFISENTYDAVFNKGKYSIHTYDEFADRFLNLSADQEWELIKLYDRYVESLRGAWTSRYTYCTGCLRYVRKDNTYTEVTTDGKLLIKCKDCNTIWYLIEEDK